MKRRRKQNHNKSIRKLSAALCIAAAVLTVGAAAFRVKKVPVNPDVSDTSSEYADDEFFSDEVSSYTEPVSNEPQKNNAKPSLSVPNKADIPVNALPSDEFDEHEDSEQTMAIQTVAEPNSYVRAVGGAVTKAYSMNNLVYSRTMGDWRVHRGVDISANKGEIVKSASEGTVSGVMNDAMYGTIVTINQTDGLMVNYCGLNSNTTVKVGDKVSAGTALGTAGEIPCEIGDGCHIHIEVMQGKKYLDPSEKLGYR